MAASYSLDEETADRMVRMLDWQSEVASTYKEETVCQTLPREKGGHARRVEDELSKEISWW